MTSAMTQSEGHQSLLLTKSNDDGHNRLKRLDRKGFSTVGV